MEMRAVATMFSGSLAFILNLVLAIVILKNRRTAIGSYSYLLFLYCVSAMIYAMTQVLTLPTFLVADNGYTFHETFHILPRFWATFAVFTFISCYVQNVVILSCSFVYRLLIVCNPDLLVKLCRPLNLFFIVVFNVSIVAYVMIALATCTGPSKVAEELLGDNFYRHTGLNLSEIGYLGAPMIVSFRMTCHQHFQVNGGIYFPVLFALGSFSMVVVFASILIAICIYKTTSILKQMVAESSVASRYHWRIFTLLILQLVMPMMFNFIPVLLVIISSYFSLPFTTCSKMIGAIMTVSQIIDPILIFVYIEHYQRYLKSFFPCLLNNRIMSVASTSPIQVYSITRM